MGVERYDVVVVGAGASGVPAAVAAAREGARVALLETRAVCGGAVRAGLGFPICGLYRSDTDSPIPLNDGLAQEFVETIESRIERRGRVFILRCSGEAFGNRLQRWIESEPNITLYTQGGDLQVEESEHRISTIRFGSEELIARTVIDCSGSGEIIQRCNALKIIPEHPALAGFMVRLGNVTENEMLSIRVPYALNGAVKAGRLPASARYTVFDDDILKLSVEPKMNAVEFSSRVVLELKSALPEFKQVVIRESSGSMLFREGIRLQGDVVLAEDDIRNNRTFSDVAARGGWPMEHWDAEQGVTYFYGSGTYDIPMGSLKSSSIDNLWAAGRAVSADSMALSSVRVAGTCMATGEAAGRAAAKEAA